MRATRAATPVLLAALVLPMLAAPALAVADPVTGYWTRTQTSAPLPVQPPDPVPEGGSWIARDPLGPVAVSAIRADADMGSLVVGFRLPVADALGTPVVHVCPTVERWAPDQGGRLEAAPVGDCSAPLEARVEEDVLLVDLPLPLQLEQVDLLLTPAPGSSFSLTLERATAEHVVQAPAAPAPAPQPMGPPTFPTGPAPAGPAFDSGFSGGTAPDLGFPAPAPAPVLPDAALPEPAAAAPVPQPQAAPAPAPAVLAARPPARADDRTASVLAVAVLAALAALALRLAVQPVAAPRHLGGGARLSRAVAAQPAPEAVVASTSARGVGRFRAPRIRPPVRI